MGFVFRAPILAVLLLLAPAVGFAEEIMIEDFEGRPEERWRFFTDTVMGGVSSGQVVFLREAGQAHARLTGSVSTANNGGFIQIRLALQDAAPRDASGVVLTIRGDDQRYFVHLRTSGTRRPWHYYQAGFEAPGEWTAIRLPFEEFRPSDPSLETAPRAEALTSIGLVAFGRDHEAELEVRAVEFY